MLNVDLVSQAPRTEPVPPSGRERGIIIGVLTENDLTNAWVAIRLLRWHGCQLPIQVWSALQGDGAAAVEGALVGEGVGWKTLAAGHVQDATELKIVAATTCEFDEVMLLEPQIAPVKDPSYLFEDPDFQETGLAFWPSPYPVHVVEEVYRWLKFRPQFDSGLDGGQMLFQRQKSDALLVVARGILEKARELGKDRELGVDVFRLACRKSGAEFAMSHVGPQELGLYDEEGRAVLCQHDFEGERVFQNRVYPRWRLHGVNPWVPGFLFEPECRAFLKELAQRWDGRPAAAGPRTENQPPAVAKFFQTHLSDSVWLTETFFDLPNPDEEPAPPPEEACEMQKILVPGWPKPSAQRWTEMEFLPNGTIKLGGYGDFAFWKLELHPDAPVLQVHPEVDQREPLHYRQRPQGWQALELKPKPRTRLLRRREEVYPQLRTNGHSTPAPRFSPGQEYRVYNSAAGIGDHVLAALACAGVAQAGAEVHFYSAHAAWLSRIRQPGLMIRPEPPPPMRSAIGKMEGPSRWIDVNYDYDQQIRFSNDKARWYAEAIASGAVPARPQQVDRRIRVPRVDFHRYVVLSPFSASSVRDWPGPHWTRLCHLLNEAGFDLVAVGTNQQKEQFHRVFDSTNAYWALSHAPEWVMDTMLGAAGVIGNDSGMVHVSGLCGVPTVALHAHLPGDMLWSHLPSIASLMPATNCSGCRWQPERGFNLACDHGCSALATIGPESVLTRFLAMVDDRPASSAVPSSREVLR